MINFGHVGDLSTLILLERLLAVGKLAGLLACAILFLAWFHRAFRNAFACGLRFFRGPGWAIGGWFLPVLHLAIPPQIQAAAYPAQATDAGTRADAAVEAGLRSDAADLPHEIPDAVPTDAAKTLQP